MIKPRICVLDIETNGINGFKADLAYLLCMGYQEYNEKKAKVISLHDFKEYKKRPYNDEILVREVHELLKNYDIVAGQYISRFDWPFLKTRFAYYKLPALNNIKGVIDTWQIARNHFKLSSNRLDNFGKFFKLSSKKMSKGDDWSIWWKRAAAGEVEAIEFIAKYCIVDVETTTEFLREMRDYWPKTLVGNVIQSNNKPWPKYMKPIEKTDDELLERLRTKIYFKEKNKCWDWLVSRNHNDYGTFKLKNKSVLAYRLIYETFINKVPVGLELDHLCCNKGCVNPYHLEPVTHKENMKRASKNGLFPPVKGESNPNAKLTEKDIDKIRKSYIPGKITQQELADKYHVSRGHIGSIVTHKSWVHQ